VQKTDGGSKPDAPRDTLDIETNVISGNVDLATLADNKVVFDGGGLGRMLSAYRLLEANRSTSPLITLRRSRAAPTCRFIFS
jgi:hypothetical protein